MKRFIRSKLVLSLVAFIMIAAAVVIPLSGSITHSHAQGITKTFTVNASQDLPGLDTGIDLAVGSGLTIKASGQAQFSPDVSQDCDITELTNPDGQRILSDGTHCPGKIDPSAVLPTSPVGTLIANIGSSGWFAVGSSDGFTSAKSGRLFLLYNDNSGEYGNNSGSYQVTVTVTTPTQTVSFTKAATPKVAPRGTISYTLTITNTSSTGSGNLHDIQLTDTPPSQTTGSFTVPTFTITPTGSATVDCTPSTTSSITCFVDDFKPGSVVTVSFSATATSTAKGTITNTATADSTVIGTVTATANTTITVPPTPRKPLVIFLQGINTSQGSLKPGEFVGLGTIPTTVMSVFGTNADYLEYSYAATTADSPYSCANTIAQPIKQDISLLSKQIANAVGSNKNTDIYLIGHSLGGVVAFGYLALLEEQLKTSLSEGVSLPQGAHLRAVITLDSPIGGVRDGRFAAFAKILLSAKLGIPGFPCKDLSEKPFAGKPLSTVDDFISVFHSPFFHPSTTPPDDGGTDPQGAQASLLAISGVMLLPPPPPPPNPPVLPSTPPSPLPLPSNEKLAEQAQHDLGTSFLSVGNTNDFLWDPSVCGRALAPIIAAVSPPLAAALATIRGFTDTQFLEDEGKGTALYGRSFTTEGGCDTETVTKHELNHKRVLFNTDVQTGLVNFLTPIAVASGPVGGTPSTLTPVPGQDVGPK